MLKIFLHALMYVTGVGIQKLEIRPLLVDVGHLQPYLHSNQILEKLRDLNTMLQQGICTEQ